MNNASAVFMNAITFDRDSVEQLEREIRNDIHSNTTFVLADNSTQIKLKEAEAKNLKYHLEVIALLEKNSELQSIIDSHKEDSFELKGRISEVEQRNIELNMQVITLSTSTTIINSSSTESEKQPNQKNVNELASKIAKEIKQYESFNFDLITIEGSELYISIGKALISQLMHSKEQLIQLQTFDSFTLFQTLTTYLFTTSSTVKSLIAYFIQSQSSQKHDLSIISVDNREDLENKIKHLIHSQSQIILEHSQKTKLLQNQLDKNNDDLLERDSNSENMNLDYKNLKQKYINLVESCRISKGEVSEKELELSTLQNELERCKQTVKKQTITINALKFAPIDSIDDSFNQKIQILERQIQKQSNDELCQNNLILDLKNEIQQLTLLFSTSKTKLKELELKQIEDSKTHSRNQSTSNLKYKPTISEEDVQKYKSKIAGN